MAQSYNYEEMEMDEYNASAPGMAESPGCSTIKELLTKMQKLLDYNTELDETQAQVDGAWDEIYAALGSSRAEDEQFKRDIQALTFRCQCPAWYEP